MALFSSMYASPSFMEGPLSKWTNLVNGWQYRWFVLDQNVGVLSYYTSKEKMIRGDRRGCVKLRGAQMGIDDEDESTFTITVDNKTFHFQARDADERQQWLDALEETRDILQRCDMDAMLSASTTAANRQRLSIKDLDRKLSESDAYLQLLIEQETALERRIAALVMSSETASTSSNMDSELANHMVLPAAATATATTAEPEKYTLLLNKLRNVIELVKRAIVALQMSKQSALVQQDHLLTSYPGTRKIRPTAAGVVMTTRVRSGTEVAEVGRSTFFNKTRGHSVASEQDMLPKSVELATDALTAVSMSAGDVSTTVATAAALQVVSAAARPRGSFTSTSSDSDDEEFYDCEDEEGPGTSGAGVDKSGSGAGSESRSSVSQIIQAADDHDFDELYDQIDEDDLCDLGSHGSVISHLISQVRIGMDLTKVTLPTFILEKRSTLEMYADFLAHPDLWSRIGEASSPKDRLVACLRWYLSAFHASRRSYVAKKPYNPILGETFQCWWDLDDLKEVEEEDELDEKSGRPVPWAKSSSVAFVAEQVSHHPPISAFYAEQRSSGQFLNGYIWTKSKFLGLSIAVHMVGQAVISITKYDEEYIVTFPSGYGRSILGTPWIELGGKCKVECPQTGYLATVDFLTKPFYGGKRDRMKAECFAPGDKRPFGTVIGMWNGLMEATWEVAGGQQVTEVFVDAQALPVMKKRVRPRSKQGEFESRRLWQEVTSNLKAHNIDAASTFKAGLEQRQRDEAKRRSDRGEVWETALFHEVGEHWVYDKPLASRIKVNTASQHTTTDSNDK